jgi:hypothetical protein
MKGATMAIGWLSLLKTVPWGEVVSNAPAIAEGAKKLWNKVGGKTPARVANAEPAAASTPGDADTLRLLARLDALEAKSNELHAQLLASTELIKALADQNTELIRRVETNRQRLLWLSGALGVAGLVLVLLLILR